MTDEQPAERRERGDEHRRHQTHAGRSDAGACPRAGSPARPRSPPLRPPLQPARASGGPAEPGRPPRPRECPRQTGPGAPRPNRPGQRAQPSAGRLGQGCLDDPRLIRNLVQRDDRPLPEIGDPSALPGPGPQGQVQPVSEAPGEVSALAAQRRQVGTQPPRPLGRCAERDRVDARERLVEDEGQRVEIGGRAGFAPSACSGAIYAAVPITSPVRVSVSAPSSRATPKSVSLATAPGPGCSGMSTFEGLTSRCTTPWA